MSGGIPKARVQGEAEHHVVVIGPFPPPLNGFSWVTSRVLDELTALQPKVAVIRTTPPKVASSSVLMRRIARAGVVSRGYLSCLRLVMHKREVTFYLPISGGIGKLIELPFVWMARARGARLFIHHHSYAYISRPSALARLFFFCCGRRAFHIALGKPMERALRETYGLRIVHSLSNAGFLPAPERTRDVTKAKGALKFGFLGNISEAKGIRTFVALCEQAAERNLNMQAHLAGPFEDERLRLELTGRIQALGNVKLWGPIYGEDKERFFRCIDVLVFPTHYANEAEPVIILEALSYGIPVLATPRGCIAALLAHDPDSVFPYEQFAERAASALERLAANPVELEAKKAAAFERFSELHRASTDELRNLIRQMTTAPAK